MLKTILSSVLRTVIMEIGELFKNFSRQRSGERLYASQCDLRWSFLERFPAFIVRVLMVTFRHSSKVNFQLASKLVLLAPTDVSSSRTHRLLTYYKLDLACTGDTRRLVYQTGRFRKRPT